MQVGDLERTSKGRAFLNTWLMPRMANILTNGEEVLFIGTDTNWDYKPFFWNPAKQCLYTTLDKNSTFNPDITANIESCPQIEDNRFSMVIMIGVYEFLDKIPEAFKEIHRILKPNGYLVVAFPGKGYYPDHRGMAKDGVFEVLVDYTVLEEYFIYEGREEPNSVIVVASKK